MPNDDHRTDAARRFDGIRRSLVDLAAEVAMFDERRRTEVANHDDHEAWLVGWIRGMVRSALRMLP